MDKFIHLSTAYPPFQRLSTGGGLHFSKAVEKYKKFLYYRYFTLWIVFQNVDSYPLIHRESYPPIVYPQVIHIDALADSG